MLAGVVLGAVLALGEGILRAIYAREDLLFRFERELPDPRITGSKRAPFSEPGSGTETDGGRPWTHTTNGQGLRERYELPCGASPPGDLELDIGSLAAAAGAASGAPVIGYAMPERACWGVADLGHPGAAGAKAIAALVAPAIAAALSGHPWVALPARATEPGCAP